MTTWGSIYWPAFLIGTAIAFIVPEAYALAGNAYNTLSYWTWQDEPGRYTWEWYVSLGMWLGFAVWITGHIWWKTWR